MFTSSRAVIHSKARSSSTKSIIKQESKLETYIMFLRKPEGMMSAKREDVDSWVCSKTYGGGSKGCENEGRSRVSPAPEDFHVKTTHTPSFLGLQQNLGFWNHSNYGKGVIIGVLETGIKASHPSFSDEGMPPPTAKWKGKCEFNATLCNDKLIGARSFYLPGKPPVFDGTVFGVPYAPQLAYFYSRGPSLASPGILKPDIIGPGVDILAAWLYAVDKNRNTKSGTFNMISGTSMATPHLTGIAALLKSSHPDWSPAAIKSAMMTTANLTNLGGTPITDDIFDPVNVFSIGSGHVNPTKADDPGLIYDIQPDDYIPYLCGLGYNDTALGIIVQRSVTCWNSSSIPEAQLNYPSFSVNLTSSPLDISK
ncbi:hypothetical protein DKX38_029216 [Salix brachista]|uniref:Peptidase S8/S53 domain-containing protein n=1 Tax=Salix brachista TaxID=2182728 RepID=A0A5N5IYK6_9ROSI|nr:hypothetical protein DKX38_029216 [Salix brachista]